MSLASDVEGMLRLLRKANLSQQRNLSAHCSNNTVRQKVSQFVIILRRIVLLLSSQKSLPYKKCWESKIVVPGWIVHRASDGKELSWVLSTGSVSLAGSHLFSATSSAGCQTRLSTGRREERRRREKCYITDDFLLILGLNQKETGSSWGETINLKRVPHWLKFLVVMQTFSSPVEISWIRGHLFTSKAGSGFFFIRYFSTGIYTLVGWFQL